jgi:hypothetical protein
MTWCITRTCGYTWHATLCSHAWHDTACSCAAVHIVVAAIIIIGNYGGGTLHVHLVAEKAGPTTATAAAPAAADSVWAGAPGAYAWHAVEKHCAAHPEHMHGVQRGVVCMHMCPDLSGRLRKR